MTIWTNQASRYGDVGDFQELDRFERINHRQQGACPVRSHNARTRANMRSRSGPGARRKARAINGAHRRGRNKQLSPGF